MPAPYRLLVAAALALPAAGCETFSTQVCDKSITGNPAVTYSGGQVQGGVYQSSDWNHELLNFPGGMIYRMEHHLVDDQQQPVTPRWVSLWVSLDRDGLGGDGGGVIARASGNEAVLLEVGPTTITVQNDGCQGYWLLVAAGTGPTQSTPP
jgi:hypothetical protein